MQKPRHINFTLPSPSGQFATLTAEFEDLAELCLRGQSKKISDKKRLALAADVLHKVSAAKWQAQVLMAQLDPEFKPDRGPNIHAA